MAKKVVLSYLVRREIHEMVHDGPGSYADPRAEVGQTITRLASLCLSSPDHGIVPESIRFKVVPE